MKSGDVGPYSITVCTTDTRQGLPRQCEVTSDPVAVIGGMVKDEDEEDEEDEKDEDERGRERKHTTSNRRLETKSDFSDPKGLSRQLLYVPVCPPRLPLGASDSLIASALP